MKRSAVVGAIAVSVAVLISGCNQSENENVLVARVGSKELKWAELMSMIPDNSSPSDSAMLAENYITGWVKEQVLINKAEENLAPEKQNFEELVDTYRKSLLTYAYEQELINQRLDTNITEAEIEKYYNDNIENFELRDYIVKVKYCAINTNHKEVKALRKLFLSEKPEDLVKWQQLCVNTGASFYFNEDKWMLFEELLKQIPLQVFDIEAFLKKNKNIEFDKDNNLYLLTITHYQLSGSASPLSFERDKIRNFILNKRKIDLVSRMREDLYQQALQQNTVELFYKKP